MRTVLLAGDHIGELETVSYQVAQLTNVCRWNKGGLDHAAHIQVADPFGIFAVSLIPLHRLGIFGMGKRNPQVVLLQDIENRNPILAGRFHANIVAVVLSKPVTQLVQAFCKGRKASLLVLCAIVGVSNTDAGIDPCFVDVKSAAIVFDDSKRQENNLLLFIVIRRTVTGHPARSSRFRKR